MAFYGSNNTLLIGDDGAVFSSFDSDGVSATTIASTEFAIASNDPENGAEFGAAVAVGSGRIVIGAHKNDISVADQGWVTIHDLDGTLISSEQYGAIFSESTTLGGSVASGGGRIAAGSSGDGAYSGLYTWDLDGENRSGLQTSNLFKQTNVALGSGKLVVGFRLHEDGSGDSEEDGKIQIYDIHDNHAQTAYMFNQTPITILSPDSESTEYFGGEVSVGNGRIFASSFTYEPNFPKRGYLLDTKGSLIKKIFPSGTQSGYFGGGGYWRPHGSDIGCGKIVVGMDGAYSQTGTNVQIGRAYVYDLNGDEQFVLGPSDSDTAVGASPPSIGSTAYGYSVAIGSNIIAVGAPSYDNGTGKVYIYNLNGEEIEQIQASDSDENSSFGAALAIGNNRLIVGAPYADVPSQVNAGKVYGYKLDGTIDTYFEDVLDTIGNNKWV